MPLFSRTLARMAGKPYADAAPDRDLIARFHRERDQAAFAALVAKHGPMVLGVCRRKLRDWHAADDAFQATFLVLAKRAGAVAWQESLGGWLYRVAERVCRKAVGRRPRTAQPLAPDAVAAPPAPPPSDLSAVLDEELLRLPAAYRDPIILCHLEGMTADEAAAALGVSDGQLRGRLYRGREKLRGRLAARGVALSATALAVALTAGSAAAVAPPAVAALAAVATAALAGPWPAAVSENVLSLTCQGLSAMSRMQAHLLTVAAAIAVTVVGVGFGVGGALADPPPARPAVRLPAARPAPARDDDDKKKDEERIDRREGTVKSVDAAASRLVVTTDEDKFDLTVDVSDKTELTVARRTAKLSDLPVGMRVVVTFRGAEKAASKVGASWPRLETVVKASDPAKGALTIRAEGNNGFEFGVALAVAPDATVEVDGLPAALADLSAGTKVRVEFAADKKTVIGVEADAAAGDLPATIKAADATAKTLAVTVRVDGPRGDRAVDLAFPLAADAKVRLAGKDVAPTELKPDMPVLVRFAADRRTVVAVWAAPTRPKDADDD